MRTVISLTTLPSRAHLLQGIIDCIESQTVQVDKIYVNLPDWSIREKRTYPEIRLRPNPRIEIVSCEDKGPITKLYPVLERERSPTTLIITLDDDIIYSNDRVETLKRWAEEFPGSAVGGSGFTVGKPWSFFGTVKHPKTPTKISVLEGVSGCAYRRGFFSDDFLEYGQAPKEAFFNDDVWISGRLAQKGIERIVHPSETEFYVDQKMPGALSADKLEVARRILPVILHFRGQGLFEEEQAADPQSTFGFWVLLCLTLLFLLAVVVNL